MSTLGASRRPSSTRTTGHVFAIGASLGVATSAIQYTSAEDVLRDADTAMYGAKETERGTMSSFDASMHEQAMHDLQLNAELRLALEDHQFEMFYQPIVNLITGRTDRFETLVRWNHPARGLVLPINSCPPHDRDHRGRHHASTGQCAAAHARHARGRVRTSH